MEDRLTLEKWALGVLPPEQVAELERRCADDAELAAWAARVRTDVEAAGDDLPMLRLPVEDAATSGSWLTGILFRPVTIAGAAMLAVLVFIAMYPWPAPTGDDGLGTTWRGSLDLAIHLVHEGDATEQGALIRAQAGDRLQYSVAAPQAGFVQVYDVQSDRTVQQWTAPTAVRAKQPETGAVLLDDYAGGERVYFIWTPEPLVDGAVARGVEQAFDTPVVDLEKLPGLPRGTIQRSILLLRGTE